MRATQLELGKVGTLLVPGVPPRQGRSIADNVFETMASANLNELLEKTADWDKDERYMATSDLCAELQKDMKIDASMERRDHCLRWFSTNV